MKRKSDIYIENPIKAKTIKHSQYNIVYTIREVLNNCSDNEQKTLYICQTKSDAIKKIIDIIQMRILSFINNESESESESDSSSEWDLGSSEDEDSVPPDNFIVDFYKSINLNNTSVPLFHNGEIVQHNTTSLIRILLQTNTIKYGESNFCIVKEYHRMDKKQFEKKLIKKMEEMSSVDFPPVPKIFQIKLNKTTDQLVKFDRKIVYGPANKCLILAEVEIGPYTATIYCSLEDIDRSVCNFDSPIEVINEIRRLRKYHHSFDLIQPRQFTKENLNELEKLILNPTHPFNSYGIKYELGEIVIGYYYIKITKLNWCDRIGIRMFHGVNQIYLKEWIPLRSRDAVNYYIPITPHCLIDELKRIVSLDFMYKIPRGPKKTLDEIFKELLDINCDVNVIKSLLQNNKINPSANNNYPLLWATMNGHLDIVKILAEDKRVDLTVNNNAPIRYAMMHNHKDIVKFLIPKIDISKITDITILDTYNKMFIKM